MINFKYAICVQTGIVKKDIIETKRIKKRLSKLDNIWQSYDDMKYPILDQKVPDFRRRTLICWKVTPEAFRAMSGEK